MMNNLAEKIKDYFIARGLTMPNFDNSMKFVATEIAEVYELDLARIGGFKRNHPENKPKFNKNDLAEELGDAIFMLMVAGIVEGVDPLEALLAKMNRKLDEELRKAYQPITMEPISYEQATEEFHTIGDGTDQWWQDSITGDINIRITGTGKPGDPIRLVPDEEPEEDTYDYVQDDLNFDAERERRSR